MEDSGKNSCNQNRPCPCPADTGNPACSYRKSVDGIRAEIVNRYLRLGYTSEQIEAILTVVVEDR